MLQLFRRYQKGVFIVITLCVVVSFSFFGAYQVIAPAFQAKAEKETTLTQMVRFLDQETWMGSAGDPLLGNFLNEGVISEQFLETGIGDLIVKAKGQDILKLPEEQLEKEKSYLPYTHPYLPSLSAPFVWSFFSPELGNKLKTFQAASGCAFKERAELFLAEKQCPPAVFAQVIRYQEQSNPQIPRDLRLTRSHPSLFGYHSCSDWFGKPFVEEVASYLLKGGALARQLGYTVSQEELIAELVFKSQKRGAALTQSGRNLGVKEGRELMQLYLQRFGFTQAELLVLLEEITLFKRLMADVGETPWVDALPLSQFSAFAHENATIELYKFAPELRLHNLEELQHFEAYLEAVTEKRGSPRDVPAEYASLETIKQRAPELVGQSYLLSLAHVSKKSLTARVTVKEMLQWEVDHVALWQPHFAHLDPLLEGRAISLEELDRLDEKKRGEIDGYARTQIVATHPEWVEEALNAASVKEETLFLSHAKEQRLALSGIKEPLAFKKALATQDELDCYTQDYYHYYRVRVQERGEEKVVSYKEAKAQSLLAPLARRLGGEQLVARFLGTLTETEQKHPWAFRFASLLERHREKEFKESLEGSLWQQFVIEKKKLTLSRAQPHPLALDLDTLQKRGNTLSEIQVDPQDEIYCYRKLEQQVDTTLSTERWKQMQQLLSQEACLRFFQMHFL